MKDIVLGWFGPRIPPLVLSIEKERTFGYTFWVSSEHNSFLTEEGIIIFVVKYMRAQNRKALVAVRECKTPCAVA